MSATVWTFVDKSDVEVNLQVTRVAGEGVLGSSSSGGSLQVSTGPLIGKESGGMRLSL